MTIPFSYNPQEEKIFSISIGGVEGSEGASVDPNRDTAEITIASNQTDDCMQFLKSLVMI